MKGDSVGVVLRKVDCGQWEILGPLSGGIFRERGGFWEAETLKEGNPSER